MEVIVLLVVLPVLFIVMFVAVIWLLTRPFRWIFAPLIERPDQRAHVDQSVEHADATEANVVEEGRYQGRKWRRRDDGVVEGELLNGSFRRFASFDDFVRYIG